MDENVENVDNVDNFRMEEMERGGKTAYFEEILRKMSNGGEFCYVNG